MSTLSLTLSPSCSKMAGGSTLTAAVGAQYTFTFAGTWVVTDRYTITFTESLTGFQFQVGYGAITDRTLNYLLVFQDRILALSSSEVFLSGIGLFHDTDIPSMLKFNDPNIESVGSVTLTNEFYSPTDFVAIAPYQGKLAFFGREVSQIWQANADPAQWQQLQVLPNIGTFAPDSVKSIGDLEVMFLHDTGIRSLRARESTLNAYVTDIGSPINTVIRDALRGLSDSVKAASCGVVEPELNQYWLHINGKIYVLSYFPGNKITAWSEFLPTWNNGGVQTAFTPEKMVVHKGRVYIRGADNAFYLYGGADNNTYDNCPAIVETPWLSAKTPATRKVISGIDAVVSGSWEAKASSDPQSGDLETLETFTTDTYNSGRIPFSVVSSHIKLRLQTTGATAAKISELVFHFDDGESS